MAEEVYRLSESLLQVDIAAKIGGSPALHDIFVTIRAAWVANRQLEESVQ